MLMSLTFKGTVRVTVDKVVDTQQCLRENMFNYFVLSTIILSPDALECVRPTMQFVHKELVRSQCTHLTLIMTDPSTLETPFPTSNIRENSVLDNMTTRQISTIYQSQARTGLATTLRSGTST
jgi:hypothetical protein